jgi:hypothetical protein
MCWRRGVGIVRQGYVSFASFSFCFGFGFGVVGTVLMISSLFFSL